MMTTKTRRPDTWRVAVMALCCAAALVVGSIVMLREGAVPGGGRHPAVLFAAGGVIVLAILGAIAVVRRFTLGSTIPEKWALWYVATATVLAWLVVLVR